MIVDKRKHTQPDEPPRTDSPGEATDIKEQIAELYPVNPMAAIYEAVADMIKKIKDKNGERYFKTVKWNSGQLNRVRMEKMNAEGAIGFPAVFINFVNVRWLVDTTRIGEGRAELRIQYVYNRLNTEDDEYQTEITEGFHLIHNQLINHYKEYEALRERFQLTYWDQPENFVHGVQQAWITYDVWFRDFSTYRYRNCRKVYAVIPPWTNHSDQDPELKDKVNPQNHKDHHRPSQEAEGFDS